MKRKTVVDFITIYNNIYVIIHVVPFVAPGFLYYCPQPYRMGRMKILLICCSVKITSALYRYQNWLLYVKWILKLYELQITLGNISGYIDQSGKGV